ncbi:MAG: hypothetical protein JW941_06270 [Candidatus Coatesbacteria bacterium]|nr:hypothetical protein [Candidatus Coatesbacteria bacterium]
MTEPLHDPIMLDNLPMIAADRGKCSLILALQAALRYLGHVHDYDYLMGLSGAGFIFYADPRKPNVAEWADMMRDHWLDAISDATGRTISALAADGDHFERDPGDHFRARFAESIRGNLESGLPSLAYGCFETAHWDIISGVSEGRLLLRSLHNQTSSTGLIDRIQPYEQNTTWPSKIILIGAEKPLSDSPSLIRRSIEIGLEVGGIACSTDDFQVTGPSAFKAWADILLNGRNCAPDEAHQHLRAVLLDARISLERFLRWVQSELPYEIGKEIKLARAQFAKSYEVLLSMSITKSDLGQDDRRSKIAHDIISLKEIEAEAFGHLKAAYEKSDGLKQVKR